MSYQKWGYIGYGIDVYDLDKEYIDHQKLKELFLTNKYDINEIFRLDDNDIKDIQKTKTTEEILELKPFSEYEDDYDSSFDYHPLEAIIKNVLEQKNYGFQGAEEYDKLGYIYLPACMPWEMGNIKNLTREELDNFVNEALKEIYKEEYYDKIPKMDYVNCVSGG